jgi:hypothetical protein
VSASIDPTKLRNLDFRIQKVNWSIYDVNTSNISGVLRLLAIPINILEVPRNLLPPGSVPAGTSMPSFALTTQGIVGFNNHGKKGPANPNPLTPAEIEKAEKQDITQYAEPREEPFNEYIVAGKPPYLVRTRTVLNKLELLVDRYDMFGDPVIWVNHSTSHSVSEIKQEQLLTK